MLSCFIRLLRSFRLGGGALVGRVDDYCVPFLLCPEGCGWEEIDGGLVESGFSAVCVPFFMGASPQTPEARFARLWYGVVS